MVLEGISSFLAAQLTSWVTRSENGGLLNAFFQPVVNTTSNEVQFNVTSDIQGSLISYLEAILLFQPPPVDILKAMPDDIRGGDTQSTPNKEPMVFWLAVGTFTVLLTVIIIMQVINCCCCCSKREVDDVSQILKC